MQTRRTGAAFVGKDVPSSWVSELNPQSSISSHLRWEEFKEATRSVQVAAILEPILDEPITGRIATFRATRPALPLVIMTLLTHDNARALNRLPHFEKILLDGEVVGQLRAALKEAASQGLLLTAATWLEVQMQLPKLLRESLAAACRKWLPVRTVNTLSTAVLGDKRQALWELWRECMPPNVKPHAFVDWLLVAHAVAFTSRNESKRAAATRLNVSQKTLEAAIRRRFGGPTFEELVAPSRGGGKPCWGT